MLSFVLVNGEQIELRNGATTLLQGNAKQSFEYFLEAAHKKYPCMHRDEELVKSWNILHKIVMNLY